MTTTNLITVREAAQRCNTTTQTIYNWIRRQYLTPYYNVGYRRQAIMCVDPNELATVVVTRPRRQLAALGMLSDKRQLRDA